MHGLPYYSIEGIEDTDKTSGSVVGGFTDVVFPRQFCAVTVYICGDNSACVYVRRAVPSPLRIVPETATEYLTHALHAHTNTHTRI
jgi:hypothetical protein